MKPGKIKIDWTPSKKTKRVLRKSTINGIPFSGVATVDIEGNIEMEGTSLLFSKVNNLVITPPEDT